MTDGRNDIHDDEIRIISSSKCPATAAEGEECAPKPPTGKPQRGCSYRLLIPAFLIIIAGLIVCLVVLPTGNTPEEVADNKIAEPTVTTPTTDNAVAPPSSHTVAKDTTVNGVGLTILTPQNGTPTLEIGGDALNDSTISLAVQAADVRRDNGRIAGAFVVKGNVVSKGEAKTGFCSIINQEITVGVADATPMFEQALMSDGYFFRQYPLVVGGQIVENKPKGKSRRSALAETEEGICVILSRDRVSYHDFSQILVDAGVKNAIALVGGEALCRYRSPEGVTLTFGRPWDKQPENLNYIVWR